MKLAAAGFSPFSLDWESPPHGVASGASRRGLFVWLRDQDGFVGWGEAAPLPGFSSESVDEVEAAIRVFTASANPYLRDEVAPLELVREWLPDHEIVGGSARFAIETALLDLIGKRRGMPLHQLLGGPRDPAPIAISGLLVGNEPEPLLGSADRQFAAGVRCLKLKVGAEGLTPAQRLTAIRLRQRYGERLALRFDPNGRFNAATVEARCAELAAFDPEYVEQPLPPGDVTRLRGLPVLVALDEELQTDEGVDRALDSAAVSTFVLKPATQGGLLRCLDIAQVARANHKTLVVTHSFDAVVGHAAACELALALQPEHACGLAPLAAVDACGIAPSEAPQVVGSLVQASGNPGLGVAPE